MIRVRCANKQGSIVPLPKDAAFIELCDDQGNIAAVVSYDPLTKSVNLFDSNSDKANRYKQLFNVDFITKRYNVSNEFANLNK